MKNVLLVLAIQLIAQNVVCSESLLSKFRQHGYKMKDTRIELNSYNKNIFNALYLRAFKYNRTTTAHNATFKFKVDVQDKLEFICQVKKFLSNEYRYFPIRYQSNLKQAFDAHVMGMGKKNQCGNVTAVFNKNITYHICNFVIDENRFPPLVPDGKYRADIQLLYLKHEIAIAYVYTEIYTPFDYSKN